MEEVNNALAVVATEEKLPEKKTKVDPNGKQERILEWSDVLPRYLCIMGNTVRQPEILQIPY